MVFDRRDIVRVLIGAVLSLIMFFPLQSGGMNILAFTRLFLENGPNIGNDLRIYYTAGYLINHQLPLYDAQVAGQVSQDLSARWGSGGWDGPYLYAPVFAVFMSPLSLLDWPMVQQIWILMILLTWISIVIGSCTIAMSVMRRTISGSVNLHPAICSLIIITNFIPLAAGLLNQSIAYNIMDGQVNVQLAALLIWSLILIHLLPKKYQAMGEIMGGLLLSIAVVIKIFPLLLALNLVFFRKWRALQGLAAGVLILLVAGFVLGGGIGNTIRFVQSLSDYKTRVYWQPNNQSFQGLWARLIGGSTFINQAKDSISASGNPLLFRLPEGAAIASYATILITIGVSIVVMIHRQEPVLSWATLLALSVMLLPKSWVHTHVITIPAFVILWAVSVSLMTPKSWKIAIAATVAIVITGQLYYIDWTMRAEQYRPLLDQIPWLWSTYVVAGLVIWFALITIQSSIHAYIPAPSRPNA